MLELRICQGDLANVQETADLSIEGRKENFFLQQKFCYLFRGGKNEKTREATGEWNLVLCVSCWYTWINEEAVHDETYLE